MRFSQATREEQVFIQTAVLLAQEFEVEIDFSRPQVMNFTGDEKRCLQCIARLEAFYPHRLAGEP
jgi:hypothetical protein